MSGELPASALSVLQSLTARGPMSPKDISRWAKVPIRTVNFAIKKLRRKGLIRRISNLQDMRSPLYTTDLEAARRIVTVHGTESIIGCQLMLVLRR
ncbi:MAG: MarR family transcriptional regulator [Candidatus Thorarchaeota archaeon]|nr:MarR family transcriptional regulator [Candidatus Thorarchaeota archaeon]MCK5239971.1 MarR family transcriptional regulator [Candidatus Thorarchaeota archaeon]